MGFSIKTLGHAFAVGLTDAWKGMKAVEKFIEKVDTPQNQAVAIGLTQFIPVIGVPAANIERGLFAAAGELAAIIHNVQGNGPQKLLDAGFDVAVFNDFKDLISKVPGLVTTAKSSVTPTDASQLQSTLFNQSLDQATSNLNPAQGTGPVPVVPGTSTPVPSPQPQPVPTSADQTKNT